MTIFKKKIFLLPHQDDELGIFNIINSSNKNRIKIFYLTMGRFSLRNSESLTVLKKLKVRKKNIFFIGDELNISDQKIIFNLNKIYKNIKKVLKNEKNFEVYTPTWEGGHPDHDATYLIGVKLKKELKIKHYHFPLYSKKNNFFFNLLVPNAYAFKNYNIKEVNITFKDAIFYFFLTFKFKSQIKTFIILWPFLISFYIFRRCQYIFQDKSKLIKKPADGKLWYELRYGFEYKKFEKKLNLFLFNKK